MDSIRDLKLVRMYRAYNTIIEMCMERGYTIRHPAVVEQAIKDPSLYNEEDGLSYNWFLNQFLVHKSKQQQASEAAADDEASREPEINFGAMYEAMSLVCKVVASDSKKDVRDGRTRNEELKQPASARSSRGSKGNIMIVFFSLSLTMAELYSFRDRALQKDARSMIVVVGSKIRPVLRRSARELCGCLRAGTTEELLRVQLFEEDELSYNISRHQTVPRHVPLSSEEAQVFLQKRHLKISQLPRILDSDPMVAYLDLSRGSIVRIVRHTPDGEPYEMYRQVI
ncbi:RNA polymerase Rpb5 C terminal domain [Trypanosoma vivax]|uniref:Putative DNA-directed RNA polymerase II n=1 Tax=Trypanosoma vivax (strain Y486) TaxID=1055687 RepID=G0U484_TRYVY|nr:RNA polymerase Rpb5 C terminal domain [Trypanosoma vivax]CCC52247.1 putative DNA-directed RNA polymerase II [Trypanosoma vivax Y486]